MNRSSDIAIYIRATPWQNKQNDCGPSEDSDQPGHPPSLIRAFAVRMNEAWVLSYSLRTQRRLWSDWADAQADLSRRWAHSHFVGFVMRWLMFIIWGVNVYLSPTYGSRTVADRWRERAETEGPAVWLDYHRSGNHRQHMHNVLKSQAKLHVTKHQHFCLQINTVYIIILHSSNQTF